MTDRNLLERAAAAMANSYSPYSRFPVGAAIECADGSVFTGCNIENCALGSTICAERVAVGNAVSQGFLYNYREYGQGANNESRKPSFSLPRADEKKIYNTCPSCGRMRFFAYERDERSKNSDLSRACARMEAIRRGQALCKRYYIQFRACRP